MQCPGCGSLKQLTPESRRSENSVWRRRICKMCHTSWITTEFLAVETKIPKRVKDFSDTMRHVPKHKPVNKTTVAKFDTSALAKIQW